MIKQLPKTVALMMLVAIFLAACDPTSYPTIVPAGVPLSSPTVAQAETIKREAQVGSLQVQVMGTDSTQVNALVRGNLTESCAKLGESQVQYGANAFHIAIYQVSPADQGCVQITSPFETTIPLSAGGLPVGTYTVTANGISASFTLPAQGAVPSPGPTLTPASQACTDMAAFVADVTIPDNTLIAAGTPFTKTWRLKNTGTCTWDSNYLVAYISGTTMTQQPGYWIVQQGQTVAPGQTADISVGMTAPVQNGNYASSWGLKRVDGQLMPIQGGANGNSFYVTLKVSNGTPAANGNVTSASIAIEPEQGSGPVCADNSTYFVHAQITTDGPATAAYEIGSTAGQIPAGNFQNLDNNSTSPYVTGALVFDQAGTQVVHLRFLGPYPYPADITVNLRVNGGAWQNAKLSCQ